MTKNKEKMGLNPSKTRLSRHEKQREKANSNWKSKMGMDRWASVLKSSNFEASWINQQSKY